MNRRRRSDTETRTTRSGYRKLVRIDVGFNWWMERCIIRSDQSRMTKDTKSVRKMEMKKAYVIPWVLNKERSQRCATIISNSHHSVEHDIGNMYTA